MIARSQFGFATAIVRVIVALFLGVVVSFVPAAAAEDGAVFDYVVLIDVSGSMVGLPAGSGNAVIFPQVQRAVSEFVMDLPDGSNLTIVPFSGAIDDAAIRAFVGIDDTDRENAVAYLDALEANGQVTWLYSAIDHGLSELEKMREADARPHLQSLFVYTDAEGNGPDDLTLDVLLQRIDAERADQEHLYVKYISLGAPVEEAATLEAHDIDVRQDPAGVVSPFFLVQVSPTALDLGAMMDSGLLQTTLEFRSNALEAAGQPISLSVVGALPGGGSLSIVPARAAVGARTTVTFSLEDAGQTIAPGPYHLDLLLESGNPALQIAPETIPMTFTIAEPTPTPVPPTPTPVPVVGVPAQIDLGSQRLNLEDGPPSDGMRFSADVPVEAGDTGSLVQVSVAGVDSSALESDVPISVALDDEGRRVSSLDLTAGRATIPLRADIPGTALQELSAGSVTISGDLRVRAKTGSLSIGGQPVGDEATIPFRLVIETYRPLNVRALLAVALAAAVMALLVGALPRLPRDAILSSESGPISLRREQRKRPLGVLFGGPITLGGSRLDIGLDRPLGRVRGGWFWPKQAKVQALDDGVEINGVALPTNEHHTLRAGDELVLAGRSFRYGLNAAAQPAIDGDLTPAPRRGFRRRHTASIVDLDDFAGEFP
jgi:hypothetical protein